MPHRNMRKSVEKGVETNPAQLPSRTGTEGGTPASPRLDHKVAVDICLLPLSSYLNDADSSFVLAKLDGKKRMRLHLTGYVALPGVHYGVLQVYVVQSDKGYYLSYRQGYGRVFYEPDYWKKVGSR